VFREPVDPERDMAPGYLTIIKKPMDLGTVKAFSIFHFPFLID